MEEACRKTNNALGIYYAVFKRVRINGKSDY